MVLKFIASPSDQVRAFQAMGADANGQPPEITVSDGGGNPCRHCLSEIPEDELMLILAFRPFETRQPYAEVGPIFLCKEACERHPDSATLPEMFERWTGKILLRGYDRDERIVYGTGQVIELSDVEAVAEAVFADPCVAFVHLRSAANNCYQCRIERG